MTLQSLFFILIHFPLPRMHSRSSTLSLAFLFHPCIPPPPSPSLSICLSVSSPLNVLGSVRHSSSSLSSHTSSETGNLLILTDGMMEHPEDLYRMQVGYISS